MEDNFYQASSERLIKAPATQTAKLKSERLAFERERPLITAVLERLEKDIARREKIDSIQNTADPEAFMREVAVNRQVVSILRREVSAIKTKVRMFDKKQLK